MEFMGSGRFLCCVCGGGGGIYKIRETTMIEVTQYGDHGQKPGRGREEEKGEWEKEESRSFCPASTQICIRLLP